MNNTLRKLVYSAVIGAIYAVLTMVLAPISYGVVQFRISEVLCVLPFFVPYSAVGLTIGCVIANLMSAAGILDVIFGSIATFLAASCTALIGIRARRNFIEDENSQIVKNGKKKKTVAKIGWGSCILACAMPVIFNAPIIGAVLAYAFTPDEFWNGFWIFGLQVGAGEAGVMFVLGLPLMRYLITSKRFKPLLDKMK